MVSGSERYRPAGIYLSLLETIPHISDASDVIFKVLTGLDKSVVGGHPYEFHLFPQGVEKGGPNGRLI